MAKKYTKTHEWIEEGKDGKYWVGISQVAIEMLGDVVYLEKSKDEDDVVGAGDEIMVIESVKAASDIYAPVNGSIREFNEDLIAEPSSITSNDWLFKMEIADPFLNALDELSDEEI
jgi:glycine cleavage system H protein